MPAPSNRFPRCAHLRASAEFQAVFGEGSRVSGALLRVHVRATASPAGPRLGLTVAKRVDKRAVGRNRIRRVLRETFRLARPTLATGDYVILAKPEARAATAAALRAECADLLARASRRAALPAAAPAVTMPALAPAAAGPNEAATGLDLPTPPPGATAPPSTRP
jgi:ribonuclease P protein component